MDSEKEAAPVTVEMDGTIYTIPTNVPPDEIVAAMWQRLRDQRHDPIRLLADQYDRLKSCPDLWAWTQKQAEPAVQEFFRTGRRDPTPSEMRDEIDSPANLIWVMTYLLRKNHPDLTDEQAMRLLIRIQNEDLKKLRDSAAKSVADAAGLSGQT